MEPKNYDYVIIGGGPTGLTLAYLLAKQRKQVLLLERNSSLGGCHRVDYTPNGPSEHGPRIYTDTMINLKRLLEELDVGWNDIFVPYHFSIKNIIGKFSKTLLLRIGLQLLLYWFNLSYKGTVADWSRKLNKYDKDLLDRLCRLIDGGDAQRFPMDSFLKTIDQNTTSTTYQPNESGIVIKKLVEKIDRNFVDIITDANINYSLVLSRKIIIVNNSTHTFENLILAIPPKSLYDLKNNLPIEKLWPKLTFDWVQRNSYNDYITIEYVAKKKIKQTSYGIGMGRLGVTLIVVSDYWRDVEGTVITVSTSKTENIKSNTVEDLVKEVWSEVLKIQSNLEYDSYQVCSGVYYYVGANNRGSWKSYDTAYFKAYDEENFIHPDAIDYNWISWVGTHNGNYMYADTSIDTAISSAYYFLGHPLLRKTITLGQKILIFLLLCVIITLLLVQKKIRIIRH